MLEGLANLSPLDIAAQALIGIIVFTSVFMVVYSIFRHPAPLEPPIHRRIAMAVGAGDRQTVFEQPALQPVLGLFYQLAKRFNIPWVRQRIRIDLNATGNPSGYSVEEYIALCLANGVIFCMATVVLTWLLMGFPEPLLVAAALVIGFYLPLSVLRGESRKRMMRISKKLPYTMDLIALMMASGATFTEAIDTVIRDDPEDDLNQELAVVQGEVEYGTSRATALRNMADRIPLDTLRSVVGAINQSEALGTPLSRILSSQASILRMHRSVRAEKLASSAALRILIPSMLILIAVVFVALAPLAIKWLQGRMWEF